MRLTNIDRMLISIALAVLAGCATQNQSVQKEQPLATEPKIAAPAPLPATPSAKSLPERITDPVTGMGLLLVKGGCFQMGSNDEYKTDHHPVHEVCVSDYYLGEFEVTQEQWLKVIEKNPSYFNQCGSRCPVEKVSWHDTQDFIKQLNGMSGKNYRLPTEAEWEYAARGGGQSGTWSWSGTNDETALIDYAWYQENSEGKTHPVGLKKPNGLGLYDMSGNVYEWCQDWYGDSNYQESPRNDPQGPPEGMYRVLRGGSRSSPEFDLRTYARGRNEPEAPSASNGFRLLLPIR